VNIYTLPFRRKRRALSVMNSSPDKKTSFAPGYIRIANRWRRSISRQPASEEDMLLNCSWNFSLSLNGVHTAIAIQIAQRQPECTGRIRTLENLVRGP